MDRAWLNLGPTLLFLGLMSAEGHLKLALAVPGSPWAGPYDPMGALYGRRGHGRLRRPRIHIPGEGKGLILFLFVAQQNGRLEPENQAEKVFRYRFNLFPPLSSKLPPP